MPGDPPDVRHEVARDVWVNWTRLALEVRANAVGGATESTRAVEELARREADAGIRQGVGRIAVSAARDVSELQEVPEFGSAIEARMSRWRAEETRYFASGRVEIDAALPLLELLKPYTLATAVGRTEAEAPQPRYTGVVVDARGTDATCAWAPRLLSARGDVLFDGALFEEVAIERSPVVYVSDPAHPVAVRAGSDPIFLHATGAEGADLVLSPEDSQRFRSSSLRGAHILGEGTVVVVVDP